MEYAEILKTISDFLESISGVLKDDSLDPKDFLAFFGGLFAAVVGGVIGYCLSVNAIKKQTVKANTELKKKKKGFTVFCAKRLIRDGQK